MKIVINLDEVYYEGIMKDRVLDTSIPEIFDSIKNGVPLPKGHWLSQREYCEMNNLIPSGLGSYFWCSECNHAVDVREWHRNHYNYCPNCGADMREEK